MRHILITPSNDFLFSFCFLSLPLASFINRYCEGKKQQHVSTAAVQVRDDTAADHHEPLKELRRKFTRHRINHIARGECQVYVDESCSSPRPPPTTTTNNNNNPPRAVGSFRLLRNDRRKFHDRRLRPREAPSVASRGNTGITRSLHSLEPFLTAPNEHNQTNSNSRQSLVFIYITLL